MEESANFIPLGWDRSAPEPHRGGIISNRPEKRIGATKEERKQIAREIRLAAKKEKKKIKADAKRQRKQNAILHRRATKNVEKYSKNKDRNKQRAIDAERAKIRIDAVHQAERLAAIHDPSGKTFNVGEVVVLHDGKVKTKESLARSAELKVQREAQAKADKEAEQAWNMAKGYAKAGIDSYLTKAKEEGKPETVALREWEAHLELAAQTGPNTSDRARYVQVVNKFGRLVNQKISKKQMRKREQLEPKPVPPRPVIPDGIPILEGETNLVALWDITDQEILKRLADQKKQKSQASKDLRKVQKEQKKFNRALKIMKKQAANAGVLWDPERAKRVILGLEPAYLPE